MWSREGEKNLTIRKMVTIMQKIREIIRSEKVEENEK